MTNKKRELLLLVNKNSPSSAGFNNEAEWLHELLFHTERLNNVAAAHEVIDLRRYKVYNNSFQVKNELRAKEERAFVFLFNKN